jgi:hypothetical protein
MSRNWDKTRERIRDWYALVERCRATVQEARERDVFVTSAELPTILLETHPELNDLREAGNALDYVEGRKGRRAHTVATGADWAENRTDDIAPELAWPAPKEAK